MLKTRKFLLTFIVIALCVILSCTFLACDKDTTAPSEETTTTQLITNGDFATCSGDAGPYTVTNWTASAGSTSSSSTLATPSDASSLAAGVVSTEAKNYKNNSEAYGNIANPGTHGDDSNVLMIYNKVATSYKYTSASTSLSQNKFYEFSVWVKTVDLSGRDSDEYGAYVYINGSAYAGFERINTQGEWKQYKAIIESSLLADGSITVVLSLGTGNNSTGHMTKGYAYFDSVTLTDLTDVEEGETAYTQAQFDAVEVTEYVQKYDMRMSDSEFNYASSTTSTPFTASKYSGVQGYGAGSSAPYSSSDVEKGILDNHYKTTYSLSNSLGDLDLTSAPDSVGTRMLYLQNKKLTAYGYRASTGMLIQSGTSYYKISVDVKTVLAQGSARVMLTNGTNSDSSAITISDISTDSQWITYTFYIEANEYRDNTLFLEMWLGFGGSEDTDTHAIGAALFDHTTYAIVDKEEYDSAVESSEIKKATLMTAGENVTDLELNTFNSTQSFETIPEGRTVNEIVDVNSYDSSSFNGTLENPLSPVTSNTNVLIINNKFPSAFSMGTITETVDNGLTINANTPYLISMWIKTINVTSGKGLTITLNSYDASKTEFKDRKTSISSLSNLNTDDLTVASVHNDYSQVMFYVLGAEYEDTKLSIDLTFGSGDGTTSANLVNGYALVSTMSIEKITYSEYTSASSGTTTATKSLVGTAKTGEVSSNGAFKFIDIASTTSLYTENPIFENGQLINYPGVPTGWTSSKSSSLTATSGEMATAGIIDLTSKKLTDKLGLTTESSPALTDSFYAGMPSNITLEDYPTCLYINAKNSKYFGYTSSSISLNANSYYAFSVWAKATTGNHFSIELATTTNTLDNSYSYYNITAENEDWNQYFIFVKTGVTSSSVKLSLYAGSPKFTSDEDNEVFFNLANYVAVNETAYKNATSVESGETSSSLSILTQSWFTDNFDSVSSTSTTVSNPSNWSGAAVDTNASTDADTLTAGVFNKTSSDWNCLDVDPDDAEEGQTIANKIYPTTGENNIGDSVLVINNKEAGAYKYTSTSATVTAGKYYKISILILTYGLKNLDSTTIDTSEDKYSSYKDLSLIPTATLTLKVNNKTYSFGKQIAKDKTRDDFDTDVDYANYLNDVKRIVNTSTYSEDGTEVIGDWTEYSFYVFAESDITETCTAALTISLGGNGVSYWESGYVFADNFAVEEISEENFIACADTTDPESEDYNSSLIDESLVALNHRIVFTAEDSTAEEETTEEETTEEESTNNLLWLYISSGVISLAVVIILIIYLVKRYAPKRKAKKLTSKTKKTPTKTSDKKDSFKN